MAAIVAALGVAVPISVCATRRPEGTGPWRVEQSRAPRATIQGGVVHITDVRHFTWRTEQDFDAAWSDGVYELSDLDRLTFYYVPLNAKSSIAHVFVSFGFGPERWLAVSVEARRRPGEDYELTGAVLRRYELLYVIGDEADVVGKRAWGEKTAVYAWPVRIAPEELRRFFLATMNRANVVAERPEIYGVVANTCATNLASNLQAAGTDLPVNRDVWLSGTMDRYAYDRGLFDTRRSFDEAKRLARIDETLRALDDREPSALAAAAHPKL